VHIGRLIDILTQMSDFANNPPHSDSLAAHRGDCFPFGHHPTAPKCLDRATMRDQAGFGQQVRILWIRGEAKICREQ